jgi:hypothetical protein
MCQTSNSNHLANPGQGFPIPNNYQETANDKLEVLKGIK